MTPFTTLTGAAAPLLLANIDTDVIVRIERLTTLDKSELGPYAFEALRYEPDGSDTADFVLNQPRFRGAPILLAGMNFGCGSSREGAVWALQGLGVRCVIAPSFGDIFFGNCFQNGVLAIRLPEVDVKALADLAIAGHSLTVDLSAQCIQAPGAAQWTFDVEPLRKTGLLEGLDEIGLTLKDEYLIDVWQRSDQAARPWQWPAPAHSPD